MTVQSASVKSLLSADVFNGINEVDDFFILSTDSNTDKSLVVVARQLWVAFGNFEDAENDYNTALARLSSNVKDAEASVITGNTAITMWVEQSTQQLVEASANMATAVKIIMALKAIYKTL